MLSLTCTQPRIRSAKPGENYPLVFSSIRVFCHICCDASIAKTGRVSKNEAEPPQMTSKPSVPPSAVVIPHTAR